MSVTQKRIFKAVAAAVILPGGLIVLVGVIALAIVTGLTLVLAFYVNFLRAAWGYAREFAASARETNEAAIRGGSPMPAQTFVPSKPPHLRQPDAVPVPPPARGWRN